MRCILRGIGGIDLKKTKLDFLVPFAVLTSVVIIVFASSSLFSARTINASGITLTPSDLFTVSATTIDWGALNVGDSVHRQIIITNTQAFPITLNFAISDIKPDVDIVQSFTWNVTDPLAGRSSVTADFMLTVSSSIAYVGKSFSFNINISGSA